MIYRFLLLTCLVVILANSLATHTQRDHLVAKLGRRSSHSSVAGRLDSAVPSQLAGNSPYTSGFLGGTSGADKSVSPIPWTKCPQSSQNSSFKLENFSPYPLRRGATVNVSFDGTVTEDLATGTTLQLKSWHMSIPFLPGPSFKINICDLVAKKYPDSPGMRCPIDLWAFKLILYRLKEDAVSEGFHVPRFLLPGKYKTTLTMQTKDKIITCVQSVLEVK